MTTGSTDFTVSPSSGSVAPGGSTAVTVTYAPTTPTSYSGVLTVQSNATSGTNSIALSGRGGTAILRRTGTSIVIVGVPSIRFPPINIGQSEQAVLTLINDGSGTLTITDLKLGGWLNDVKHFVVSPTSLTIPRNQSRTTVVTFAPKFDTGLFYMDTQLTVVSDQSGGDTVIGLHGCVRFSC